MIKSVTLKDFEAHKNSTLEFCKGINTIVGASDQGKSSVLRGINLVLRNKPNGVNFVNYDALNASVELSTDNHTATRIKGKTNKYVLDNKELTAFGQDVPDDIKEALNFNDLNIQYQMDSPFLLSSSSGEVAKVFNRVVDLEKVDVLLSRAEKLKRKHKNDYESYLQTEQDLESSVRVYDWLEKAEKELSIVESLQETVNAKSSESYVLSDLLEEFLVHTSYSERYNKILKYQDNVEKLDLLQTTISKNKTKHDTLSMLLLKIKNHSKVLDNCQSVLKHDKSTSLLDKKVLKLQEKQDKLSISYLLDDYKQYTKSIKKLDLRIDELEEQYHTFMPSTCPLCGHNTEET